MTRRLAFALALAALAVPAAASAQGGTFVVVSDQAVVLPSPLTPNTAGQIAVDESFTSRPTWFEQRSAEELKPLWERAGAAYGVPWPVLAAINKIETNFGSNMGPSSAGAVGWMQFMPETWLRWGLDADGDGVADPWDPDDAIYAAGRYLAAAGASDDIARAIFAYNHADWYVDDVLELAALYAGGTIETPAFAIQPSYDLAAVQQRVTEAADALARAIETEQRLARLEQAALARVDIEDDALLSDLLIAQKQMTQVGMRRDRAAARVAGLRGELEEAESALQAARAGVFATPFALATAPFAFAPTPDGYVFPVGGGPGNVATAATHHDYPAADISAPTGSPVFAITDGVVLRGWHSPEGRCGVGFTMRALDGREWTFCHLSYLEPSVITGTTLSVGSQVGLVGSTGTSSTGPHLHLQLAPAGSYPQDEAWFQSFAGTAFSWIGPPPAPAARITSAGSPVFAVVPDEGTSPAAGEILFTKNP